MSTATRPAPRPDEPGPTRQRRAPGRLGWLGWLGWWGWVGVALVLGGAALLGYVGWQLYGTDVVSQRRHDAAVEQLERAWQQADGPAAVRTGHGTVTAVVRIPALGEDYAVPLVEGVSDEALASGIGRFTASAEPGDRGNVALAGHRVTHGEPLRDLPDLEPGDEVVLETRDRSYHYVLDTAGTDLRVPFTAGWVVGERPENPDGGVAPPPGEQRLLTLTTCAELFHTDDRLVVFGHLDRVRDVERH